MEENKIIIYIAGDGHTKIDVKLEEETLWLTQAQMCELYQTSKSNVSEHIKHIFEDGELQEDSVVRNFRTTAADGKSYMTTFYNLDMIIALGYRVRSIIATRFRQWATERLREYIVKGFTLDDERLKKLGGGGYWKELLERIRDIRATEKVLYRQVLEIYATSIDYDPRAAVSQDFFKKVQNKIHYAIHGHTAAELIVERACHLFPLPVVADYEVSVHHVRGIVSAASAVYLVHVRHDTRIGPCPALYGIEVSFPVLVMRDAHSRQFRLEKAYHGLLPA